MENTAPSSESLDLNTIRSEIEELQEIVNNCKEDAGEGEKSSDSDPLLADWSLQLKSKVEQIVSECSDFSLLGIEDLDAFMEHLKEELNVAEAESSKISNEIEVLRKNCMEDSSTLEGDVELLNFTLDLVSRQDMEIEKQHACNEDVSIPANELVDCQFEILELDNRIEKSKTVLKTLQDFDSFIKRVDSEDQIEDALLGLKVLDFDENSIRLSMRTYLPKLEELSCQVEDVGQPSEINHELVIVLVSGTTELRDVEIFPNDVYISDIIDAAKSVRESFSNTTDTRSPLEWFVRGVQDRIVLSTLRRLVVKSGNKSRHSFEYLDRDGTIRAHLVGGVEAFIKLCQGWPMSNSPLKLVSLKSSDNHSKDISLSFLCKVEEMANSLDAKTRLNLVSFADAIEKLLAEQMRIQLNAGIPE